LDGHASRFYHRNGSGHSTYRKRKHEDTGDEYTDNDTVVSVLTTAGVTIPTDKATIAKLITDEEYGDNIQAVDIELTDKGFSQSIVVVQAELDVRWNIKNSASGAENGIQLLVPNFATQLLLGSGENPLYFFPTADFEFSTGTINFTAMSK
jgi:hypothetical protein